MKLSLIRRSSQPNKFNNYFYELVDQKISHNGIATTASGVKGIFSFTKIGQMGIKFDTEVTERNFTRKDGTNGVSFNLVDPNAESIGSLKDAHNKAKQFGGSVEVEISKLIANKLMSISNTSSKAPSPEVVEEIVTAPEVIEQD